MIHKSLHLLLPNSKPFDKENWFESFVGNFVVPIIATGKVHQYWFSRYGRNGQREIRFRFALDDYDEIKPLVEELIVKYSLCNLKDEDNYNVIDNLGTKRFLGNNQRQSNRAERAQLVFDYLHSISRLFVDCLSHSDENKYFYQEKNTDLNNPHGSVFESLHHLLCNITDATTVVVEVEMDNEQMFLSELYLSHLVDYAQRSGKDVIQKRAFEVRF